METFSYDDMKKMLKTSRKGVISQLIKEDQGELSQTGNQSSDQPTTEFKHDITDVEIETEKNTFASNVTKLVSFGDFKITNDNVSWSGVFPKEKIEWVYSLDSDEGVYISCELTQLTDNTLTLVQKLRGYYEKWAEKWSGEIGVKGTGEDTQNNLENKVQPGDRFK
jgi:hypothetical protein